LTISAGISSYIAGSGANSELLLRQADIALYEAKAAGRNQVGLADPANTANCS
jgi:GGDEF domain-containing protein